MIKHLQDTHDNATLSAVSWSGMGLLNKDLLQTSNDIANNRKEVMSTFCLNQKKIAVYENTDWKKQTEELLSDSAAANVDYAKYTVKQLKAELKRRGTMSPKFIEYPHSHMK